MSQGLILQNVEYGYPLEGFRIASFNLQVPVECCCGIVGANGSGKSTILKIIGGHLFPQSGKLFWNSIDVTHTRSKERPFATVFQDHALFPHMSVLDNVSFGLRYRRGLSRLSAQTEALDLLEKFHLVEYKDASPSGLSLGEQQRVAIVRALAVRPSVLLLDEPTASLDTRQTDNLARFLKNTLKEKSVDTIILVTHDRVFALSVCDRIALIDKGNLVGESEKTNLYLYPPNEKVARYFESWNIIKGGISNNEIFVADSIDFQMRIENLSVDRIQGRKAILIHSEHLRIGLNENENGFSKLSGAVEDVLFKGMSYIVVVRLPDAQLIKCENISSEVARSLVVGEGVNVSFSRKDARIISLD